MIACKRLTLFLTGLLVLFACAAANAVVTTTTYGPFAVNCTGAVQLCNNTFSQTVTTAGTLQVQYNASAGHCSNVAAHVLVDGVQRAVTGFLTPGQASGFLNVGPVSAGTHTVALQGEGTVGGCNAGFLANWGGTMDVMVDTLAATSTAAIPALDPAMLALLSFLLAAAVLVVLRRRR